MFDTDRLHAEKFYKSLYLTFCADGSMENRLILAEAGEILVYRLGLTWDEIDDLQTEALEELDELNGLDEETDAA